MGPDGELNGVAFPILRRLFEERVLLVRVRASGHVDLIDGVTEDFCVTLSPREFRDLTAELRRGYMKALRRWRGGDPSP